MLSNITLSFAMTIFLIKYLLLRSRLKGLRSRYHNCTAGTFPVYTQNTFKLLECSFSITISLHSLYNDEQLSSFDGPQAPQISDL